MTEQLDKDRGQALILMLLAMSVIFVVGFIIVDVGLWLTERRGAQKDADATVMAGAFELLDQDFVNFANNDQAAITARARAAVDQWATFNGLPLEDIVEPVIIDDTDCFGPSPVIDTVELAAEHHSQLRFAGFFTNVLPEIGAPAKACLGSINTAEGLLPVGVQIAGVESDCWDDVDGDGYEDPLFGQDCVLTFGASQQVSGESGMLRLYDDGSMNCSSNSTGGGNEYREEIEQGGANTTCHVYKYFLDPSKSCDDDPGGCVWPKTGVQSNPGMQAFNELILKETQAGYDCDERFGDSDTYDEFLEVVEAVNGDTTPSPDTLFARRDCVSPRLVSLIILREFDPQGNAPAPIEAFAAFFIVQCEDQNVPPTVSRRCDPQDFSGQIGQIRVRGFFVNILAIDGGVGQISKWSPKRIVLVE